MSDCLRLVVRCAAKTLNDNGPISAPAIAEFVRTALAERGLGPGCHEGVGGLDRDAVVEWYAGQLLSIVDSGKWVAVNSWLNCVDKFAP